jgi:tryptophan synthase beta chain
VNKKYLLDEGRIPRQWYNIAADFPVPPAPPLHPGTLQPAGPEDLAPLFPMGLIMQEASGERFIPIPDEVREVYRIWRPTPLVRATGLEKALGVDSKIFFKHEGVSPSGSHKSNTAVAQAYYNREAGVRHLTTETGAGQWGSALAMACRMFGLDLQVFMVKVSYHQKPYRRSLMQLYGAEVFPSPSERTEAGRAVLAADPDSDGSLGIAISEAVEVAAQRPDVNYSLGSVLNHVLLHQTVIGEEALEQCALADAMPDVVIGCVGGGSSFAGIGFPFLREKLAGKLDARLVAVEPTACPTLTKGVFTYDFGDVAMSTPLLKMYTLGHGFMPAGIHAGGLRYHGMAPLMSHAYDLGLVEAVAVRQTKCFEAAQLFAITEGVVPAPESSHAIRVAIDEALKAREEGVRRTILFNLTGHGLLDLASYDAYLAGQLLDYDHPEADIADAVKDLPQVV